MSRFRRSSVAASEAGSLFWVEGVRIYELSKVVAFDSGTVGNRFGFKWGSIKSRQCEHETQPAFSGKGPVERASSSEAGRRVRQPKLSFAAPNVVPHIRLPSTGSAFVRPAASNAMSVGKSCIPGREITTISIGRPSSLISNSPRPFKPLPLAGLPCGRWIARGNLGRAAPRDEVARLNGRPFSWNSRDIACTVPTRGSALSLVA